VPFGLDFLLENSIVAGNSFSNVLLGIVSIPGGGPDVYGTLSNTSTYYNLIGNGSGMSGITNGSNGNQVGNQNSPLIDPKLALLGNYGGPTQTMALLPGSPAIDAGSSTVPSGLPPTDQRGYARTINGQVDIGAVEYQYDLGLGGSVASGSAPGAVQYVYTVTNNGPDAVAGATLTVPLPQGIVFQSRNLPTGWIESDPGVGNNGTVAFTDTSSLNPGQSANFTVAAQVQNPTVGTVLSNTATVGPNAWDNNPQNNSVTLTITSKQEGQTFNHAVLFHFTDANNPQATGRDFSASVTWGDGSSNTSSDGSGTVSVAADPNGGFDVLGSHTYAEEGNYGTTVAITGLDGTQYNSGSAQQQLFAVADAPLTAGALTPPANANINQAITNTLLFHFNDANPNATVSDFTATVNWGDGSSDTSGDGKVWVVANPAGGFDVYGSHTYTSILGFGNIPPGTFAVTVTDAGGASTSASDSNFQVLYPDQPLTAGTLNVPSVTTEGRSISNQVLFTFTDPDTSAQVSDYLATVSWGDGSYNSSNGNTGNVQVKYVATTSSGEEFEVLGTHTYSEGSFYFGVKVTDLGDARSTQPDRGGQITGASSTAPLTITDPAVLVTAGPTFTATLNTLSAVQTVATFTDPAGPETNDSVAPYVATIRVGRRHQLARHPDSPGYQEQPGTNHLRPECRRHRPG
jgi:uncharacterized repeat protein (TIGR01451 family)